MQITISTRGDNLNAYFGGGLAEPYIILLLPRLRFYLPLKKTSHDNPIERKREREEEDGKRKTKSGRVFKSVVSI